MSNIPRRSTKSIRPCWEAVLDALPNPDDLEYAASMLSDSSEKSRETRQQRLKRSAEKIRVLKQQSHKTP